MALGNTAGDGVFGVAETPIVHDHSRRIFHYNLFRIAGIAAVEDLNGAFAGGQEVRDTGAFVIHGLGGEDDFTAAAGGYGVVGCDPGANDGIGGGGGLTAGEEETEAKRERRQGDATTKQ